MKKVTFLLLIFLLQASLQAQTTEPLLMLNTTMHTARINSINTNATGQFLVTSSDDKTARIWDANTGNLINTFRPPIGIENDGLLYACALSPDGQTCAVAGWTAHNEIFLFNVTNGELKQRLNGLNNVVQDLEYSPDGQFLAAAIGENNGIALFKIADDNCVLHATLEDYGSTCYNLAFSADGRLATVCYDGKIRLYNNGFTLQAQTTGSGAKPQSVAFSPDGETIAVGYNDAAEIDVFNSRNLKLLFNPTVKKMDEAGGLNKVCFSADGRYLYAGGGFSQQENNTWWRVVRQWTKGGKGGYTDYPACSSSITDIKSLPGGDIMVGGMQPDFCRLDSKGHKLYYREGEIQAFNVRDLSHFKTNLTGDIVAFTSWGKDAMQFSVPAKKLASFLPDASLQNFRVNQPGLALSDWQNTNDPKINGKPVAFLEPDELCRSADIAPAGERVVFGASWTINCVNTEGILLWEADVQGEAWAVNISGNGRCVAAALDNGLINWYSMADGKLLLSLYAHPDNRRWVLWTPSGYYDCAPGAEDLIGWHLNNGPDHEAYFFPASKFRDRFFRPDIIENILVTYDEQQAISLANAAANRVVAQTTLRQSLPPVVRIIAPAPGEEVSSTTVTLRYSATSPNGEPISDVKTLVDGRPVESQRGFKPTGNTHEITLTIPPHDATLSVMAQNTHGWSEAATVSLKWKGATQTDLLKPTLYLLAIGVSQYADPHLKLELAAKDARDFASTMQLQKGGLYKEVVTQVLTDGQASRVNIIKGLKWLRTNTTSRDVAMLFIAGHGINDNAGTFYFLPAEADVEEIEATCLMFAEIQNTVATVPGKIVVFADACHSGNIMGGRRAADMNGLVNELVSAENGGVVFTSSTGKQYSLEKAEWGNGAFTKALIEGMNGKADLFGKGTITVKTLDAWVADRVKQLTAGQQSPTAIIPNGIQDFPVGVVK